MVAQSRLYRTAVRLEDAAAQDGPVGVLAAAARRTVTGPRRRSVLGGRWLGHALHPLLTDVPLGTWMSASFLDLAGGRAARPAAQRLVAAGLVASLPTVAAGLSDWTVTTRGQQRVGVVHAAANTAALGLYAASLVARRRGRHPAGVGLGLLGATAASVGGFFGGHLALATDASERASRDAVGLAPTPPSGATPSSSPSAP
ncbi:MAG TPA: DUF2231 domain-containing protein [Acidimicrobiales bacterium]|jgi:uncharacterized membrane protein